MIENQEITVIEKTDLLAKVRERLESGDRLVQIGATRSPDHLELNYSFDNNFKFRNYKLILPLAGAEVPSVSAIYWAAFLYENEIHDLFGIKITDIALDYQGKFYKKAMISPFNPPEGGPIA
ncbi:MAG: NADH-quinone oxidoreductase subunit C [Candidatus Margulisiibacteriota bacterium]|jgi:ech hydrogenase subunit D